MLFVCFVSFIAICYIHCHDDVFCYCVVCHYDVFCYGVVCRNGVFCNGVVSHDDVFGYGVVFRGAFFSERLHVDCCCCAGGAAAVVVTVSDVTGAERVSVVFQLLGGDYRVRRCLVCDRVGDDVF